MVDERAVVSQRATPYYQVMPKTVTDVLADALRLEPDARAEVAAELLASLDGPADPDADAGHLRAADGLATVVTNGPLLRPFVEGSPPGEVFLLSGGKRTVSIALNLATRTKIDYLEIVKDGATIRSVRARSFCASGMS